MIHYQIHKQFKESGKSYRTLAKEIGLAYVTIAKLANARTQSDYEITTYVIDRLCRYFKKQPSDFLAFRRR